MNATRSPYISLLCCYEMSCGGETRATESICRALVHTQKLHVKTIIRAPLTRTDMCGFLWWLTSSLLGYAKTIALNDSFDWIYTTTYTGCLAAWFLNPWKKHHIALHYHGNRVPVQPRRGHHWATQSIKYRLVLWLHRLSLAASNIVFVPSEFTKRMLSKTYRNIEHKIIVVPNGVDPQIFRPLSLTRRSAIRKRIGIPLTQKVILYVGRLQPKKGLNTLLHVFTMLKKYANACLYIVYPFTSAPETVRYKENLQSTIRALGIQEKVRWFMDLNDHSMMEMYNVADVFTLFSREEHMPLVLLEALACGTPIVSMQEGGISGVLQSVGMQTLPRGATQAQEVDAIRQTLALTQKEKSASREMGKAYASRHSWNTTAMEIYRDLFNYPKKNR